MIESSVCFFTCVTNGYDALEHFINIDDDDFHLNIICDTADLSFGFNHKNIKFHFIENRFESIFLYNRWYKFFPFEVFPDFKYYVYFDANIELDFTKLKLFLRNNSFNSFNSFNHPSSRSLIEEAVYNLTISKINLHTFTLFKSQFIYSKYLNYKVTENCVLIFSNLYISKELALLFFDDISLYKRDQLVLIPFLYNNQIDHKFFDAKSRDFIKKKLSHIKTNSLPVFLQFFYPFYSKIKFIFYKWLLTH